MAEPNGRPAHCEVVDCRPPEPAAVTKPIPRQAQAIDYMAKDYDSFLRALLDQLPARLPGWKDRTEADLGMAILEVFAFLGDQLSYYQDRVANEAFLATATQYESVRKLLRLIDYRVDPGLAEEVLLTVEVTSPLILPASFEVRSEQPTEGEALVFQTKKNAVLHPNLNTIGLHAAAPSNPERTRAVLAAELDQFLLPKGSWLLLASDENREWAQVAAPVTVDTVSHTTTVTFRSPLLARYPVATTTVYGNGVSATHGRSRLDEAVGTGKPQQEISLRFAPLTHVADDDGKPVSTLIVTVDGVAWTEVDDFVASTAADAHYRVSRDHSGFATVRFGDGEQGRLPAQGAAIQLRYRSGIGEAGRVAAATLTKYQDGSGAISGVTNPLPSFGGRDPESADLARLLGPRQLWQQNRAVTPADYEKVLLAGVKVGTTLVKPLHAKARFEWTGSWTTVVVGVHMADREPLSDQVRAAFTRALAAAKLAGYDVRVEDARYAALHIGLVVHVHQDHFARQIRDRVATVLGSRVHGDGTVGFFAPQRFGFGDDVYLSDLYAAVMAIEGVEALAVTRFKRLGDRYPDREAQGFIAIDPLEIARCDSDPAHPEHGVLYVRTCGGKEG